MTDYNELKKLAEASTTWDFDSNTTPFYNDADGFSQGGDSDGSYCIYVDDFVIDGETCEGAVLVERCSKEDAYFICAAKPQVLSMLDHIAQLERNLELEKIESATLRHGLRLANAASGGQP